MTDKKSKTVSFGKMDLIDSSIQDSKIFQIIEEFKQKRKMKYQKNLEEKFFNGPDNLMTSKDTTNSSIDEGEVLASMVYDKLDQLSEVLSEEEYEELEQQIMKVMQ